MKQDILPPVFGELRNQVSNVRKKSQNEYSSSCPQCGGDDRFVIFVVGKGGFPFAFCRQDPSHRWYPAKDHKLSQSEVEEFRRNQIEVERSRIEAARRTIEILQNDRMWEFFYGQNNDWSRETFRKWGIADSWIDYLQLGLIADYTVKNLDGAYHSPAFTIPVWGAGSVVQNIKLRLANPQSPRDRYRNFYKTGQSFLFVPLHDLPLQGKCVLVEGEKKAIVLEQTLDDVNYRVVGIQSKMPDPLLFKQLRDFEAVYIWLDPDAFRKESKSEESAVEYVSRIVGKERSVIVDCPVKLDDGIIQGMNPWGFIKMGKRA